MYRQALERVAATAAAPVTFAGRTAYRFSLPVQELGDGVRIAQVVTVDARTLLPERIEWRERRPGGRVQTAAVIDIRDVGAVARDQAPQDAFLLTLPRGRVVTQLAAPGRPVRLLGTRRLTLRRGAGALPAALLARPARRAATRSARSRSTATTPAWRCGCATARCRCGTTGRSCRRRCVGNRLVPLKQIVIGARSARVYSTVGGQLAVETDRPGGTAALIGPDFTKLLFFEAIGHLRPLPRR